MNIQELELFKQLATRLLNLIGEDTPSSNQADTWLDISEMDIPEHADPPGSR